MTITRKKSFGPLLLLLIGLLIAPSAAEAQAKDGSARSVLSLQTGYATFTFSNLRSMLDQSVSDYLTRYHIRMQKLTEYPGNWIVGGTYSYRVEQPLWLTLGGSYTKTRGTLGYRDVNGRLGEEIRVQLYALQAGACLDVVQWKAAAWYLGLRAGVLRTDIARQQDAEFVVQSELNDSYTITDRSYHFAFDMVTGLRTRVFGATLSLECSRRFNQQNGDDHFTTSYTNHFIDDFGGWTFSSSVGIPLRW